MRSDRVLIHQTGYSFYRTVEEAVLRDHVAHFHIVRKSYSFTAYSTVAM